ncbi:hypothetical protein LEBRON_69 [Mycobacterium phage LeBron]|uniref:Uncharacterized protein n=1 Tax=Mycobacterium phage LeBron TaxID=2919553 RepID=E0YPK2_9CAUD|nr:hypothetical protein LEBRON_69 [Mycobacterium phage LeBron]ADL71032.1 hypothetical protein LEBRON_69 [Mycobacterium phage LeBron]
MEMAKAKGHKADEQLSTHIFHPNGSGYKIELRLGDKW